jgi:hypothetical protein
MIDVVIVVREPGRLKPDYSRSFKLPEVPVIGSYISITLADVPEPYSEDFVVRKVWWRLSYPPQTGIAGESELPGALTEIMVECDIALGPYATQRWKDRVAAAEGRGVQVEKFEVARTVLSQPE